MDNLAHTIYTSSNAFGTSWRITQQPDSTIADPMVVSFCKWNARRQLLDQSARWTGHGWAPTRWVPKPPTVPAAILDLVERHMRDQ